MDHGEQAIRIMRDQRRGGHIFNMDGAGADGNPTPRYGFEISQS